MVSAACFKATVCAIHRSLPADVALPVGVAPTLAWVKSSTPVVLPLGSSEISKVTPVMSGVAVLPTANLLPYRFTTRSLAKFVLTLGAVRVLPVPVATPWASIGAAASTPV